MSQTSRNGLELVGDGYDRTDGEGVFLTGTRHIVRFGSPLCGNPHVQRNLDREKYKRQETAYPLGDSHHSVCDSCARSFLSRHGSNDEMFVLMSQLSEGDYVEVTDIDGNRRTGRVRHPAVGKTDPSTSRYITIVLSNEPMERWAYGVEETVSIRKYEGDTAVNPDTEQEFRSLEAISPPDDCPDRRTEEILADLEACMPDLEYGEYGGAKAAAKDPDVFSVSIKGEEEVEDLARRLANTDGYTHRKTVLASEREHSSYSSVSVQVKGFK